MKQGMLIIAIFLLASCSTAVSIEQHKGLDGVWSWERVEFANSTPILKKHVLALDVNQFEESFFEDDTPKGQENGSYMVIDYGTNIAFTTTGNARIEYRGYLSGNDLVIESTNGHTLLPPALYKRN